MGPYNQSDISIYMPTILMYLQEVEQHSMENILTDTRQLEKDNNMTKMELENRIEDLTHQNKAGGDIKVSDCIIEMDLSRIVFRYIELIG